MAYSYGPSLIRGFKFDGKYLFVGVRFFVTTF